MNKCFKSNAVKFSSYIRFQCLNFQTMQLEVSVSSNTYEHIYK